MVAAPNSRLAPDYRIPPALPASCGLSAGGCPTGGGSQSAGLRPGERSHRESGDDGVALSYTLNGQPFGLQPGTMEQVGTASVIQFDRGNGLGIARYTLDCGTYTFTVGSNGGWDLVRTLG
jgi:hypothetical protein